MSLPSSWVGDSTDSQQKTGRSRLLQSSSHGEYEEPCKSGCFELVSLLFGENQLKLVFPPRVQSTKGDPQKRGFQSLTMASLNKSKYCVKFWGTQECYR